MLSETLQHSQQCLIILPYWAENCKCFFQFFLLLPKDCPAEKENRPALRSVCCPAGQTAGKPRQRLQPSAAFRRQPAAPAVKALLPGRQAAAEAVTPTAENGFWKKAADPRPAGGKAPAKGRCGQHTDNPPAAGVKTECQILARRAAVPAPKDMTAAWPAWCAGPDA